MIFVKEAKAEPFKHDPINLQMHILMAESTYRVHGKVKLDNTKTASGTAFILQHPFKTEDITKEWKGDLVLVTAAHVLDEMDGDFLTIDARTQKNGESWSIKPTTLRIRKEGKPIYSKHPEADVAAMWLVDGVEKEDDASFHLQTYVPSFFLLGDAECKKLKLNIGSPLSCLGYPFGVAGSDEGFAILRGGAVASYPMFPLKERKTFHFDFEVYPGNSGGPVYYFEPGFVSSPGPIVMTKNASRGIIGLVTAQRFSPDIIGTTPDGKPIAVPKYIKLGVVVSAPIILETINLLRLR